MLTKFQLAPNTQATLLLTAPLIVGRGARDPVTPLSTREYNELVKLLQGRGLEPADLFDEARCREFFQEQGLRLDRERISALLGRAFQLSQAIEQWTNRGIWVLARGDERYPSRWKTLLKEQAPPIIYGCGDLALLAKQGCAIVGSRHADEPALDATRKLAEACVTLGWNAVSGGAKGVDAIAMGTALHSGGTSIGVLADDLARTSVVGAHREALQDRKLLLMSPFDPNAGFNVGNAMNRNKLIYATADYAVVMCSDVKSGGTWSGAIEQLERFHFCPVFVSHHQPLPPGNRELLKLGALPLSPFSSASELKRNLASASVESREVLQQESLFSSVAATEPNVLRETYIAAPSADGKASPQERLLSSVIEILRENLNTAASSTELAKLLNVTPAQMKLWLKQLTRNGFLEQTKRPVRYQLASSKLPLPP